MAIRKILWVLLIVLTGCSPLVTVEAPAPPETIKIEITPTLRNYQDEISNCALQHPDMALILEERPAISLEFGSDAMTLSLEYPSLEILDYAVQLGMEEIVVVGGRAIPFDEIDTSSLAALFTATEPEFQVWSYAEENELRQIFEQDILMGKETTPSALIATSPEIMLAAIEDYPRAIGYIPLSWLDEAQSIQIIPIQDKQIEVPILAITDQEPEGAKRAILACLQEGMSQ